MIRQYHVQFVSQLVTENEPFIIQVQKLLCLWGLRLFPSDIFPWIFMFNISDDWIL